MENDTHLHKPEKGKENHKTGDKPPEGAQIANKADNSRQEEVKKNDAWRSFKLTKDGQNSFTIVDELKQEIKDHRPLRLDDQMVTVAESVLTTDSKETRESITKDVTGREVEHVQSHPAPLGEKIDELKSINYDAKTGAPETTITKYEFNGRGVHKNSEDSHDSSHTRGAEHSINVHKPAHEGRLDASEKDLDDTHQTNSWESKRRDQLVERYIKARHFTPEQAREQADKDIAATKEQIGKQVEHSAQQKKAELVKEYHDKRHMSFEEANKLADSDIAKSRHKIEENVERFEVERREQLVTMYAARGETRERAIIDAENKIAPTDEQTIKNVAQIETVRREQLEQVYKAQNMSPERAATKAEQELNDTYKHIYNLIETPCQWKKHEGDRQPGLDASDRCGLAEDVLHQVAYPTEITQGRHNTCNATTVETTTYTRHPSEAARLVEKVAIDAKYTANGPPATTIEVPKENIEYHHHADDKNGPVRSFASQIFQTTVINLYYIGRHSSIKYTQTDSDGSTNNTDSGERLTDYSTKPPKVLKSHNPGLAAYPGHFMDIQAQITGETGELLTDRPADAERPAIKHIDSPEDLKHELEEAKKNGKFPITVEVNLKSEPFRSESGARPPWGMHVVTICGYDDSTPGSPKIYIDNQWSPGLDRLKDHVKGHEPLSVQEMYQAMKPPYEIDLQRANTLENRRQNGNLHGAAQDRAYHEELAKLQQSLIYDWPTMTADEKNKLIHLMQHLSKL
jgi:hypothetical protein